MVIPKKTNNDSVVKEETIGNGLPNVNKEEEMVPLSMLQDMMSEIKDLKEGQKNIKEKQEKDEDKPEDVVENVVRLIEYNDKLVISFNEKRGTWKKYDRERREDMIFMEVQLMDEKGNIEKAEVDYHELMEEGKLIECDVVKIDTNPTEEKGKKIFTREVKDYKTVVTKNRMTQVVMSTNSVVTLKIPKPYNKEMKIDINYVNIK